MNNQEPVKIDNNMRRLARLAAVQGLYQLALCPEPAEGLIRRFSNDPCVLLQEERSIIAVDKALFGKIVSGVAENEQSIDTMIAGAMDSKLSANRLEPLLRAILRAGAFELLHNQNVATGIIVNDYIDVTRGFFGAKEPGLVNAVLDRLAKNIRA